MRSRFVLVNVEPKQTPFLVSRDFTCKFSSKWTQTCLFPMSIWKWQVNDNFLVYFTHICFDQYNWKILTPQVHPEMSKRGIWRAMTFYPSPGQRPDISLNIHQELRGYNFIVNSIQVTISHRNFEGNWPAALFTTFLFNFHIKTLRISVNKKFILISKDTKK